MEWPSANTPDALVAALEAFLTSPDQPKDSKPLEHLRDRLEELGKVNQASWAKALGLLADASRDYSWREPIEQSGLLKYYLESLHHNSLPTESSRQLLRAVGNAVADRDESRAVVPPFLENVISCLQDATLMPLAISVLYNLSLHYEPAQKEAAGLRLDRQLCRLLSIDSPVQSQAIELLTWVSDKLPETVLSDSEDCLRNVLDAIAACDDWDDYRNLQAAASVYLQDASIQTKMLQSDGLEQIVHTLLKAEELATEQRQDLDEEALKEFENDVRLTTGLVINETANITAADEFNQKYTLTSPFILEQGSWLKSTSPILQTSACVLLGNLAISDPICTSMVQDLQFHIPVLHIFASSSDRTLLYLAAGFMRHLAQPAANSSAVAGAGAIAVAPTLLARKEAALDFEVAAILRRLVNGDVANAAALIREPTLLPALLDAAAQTKTAFEVGRLVVALCRELRKAEAANVDADVDADGPNTQELWPRLLQHAALTKPLALMLQQAQVPALRSEAWFGFSLLAAGGRDEGAEKVGGAFCGDEGLFGLLRAAVLPTSEVEGGIGGGEGTGAGGEREGGKEATEADRKNALALAHLVAQKVRDEGVKARFEGLLREREGRGRVLGEVEEEKDE